MDFIFQINIRQYFILGETIATMTSVSTCESNSSFRPLQKEKSKIVAKQLSISEKNTWEMLIKCTLHEFQNRLKTGGSQGQYSTFFNMGLSFPATSS